MSDTPDNKCGCGEWKNEDYATCYKCSMEAKGLKICGKCNEKYHDPKRFSECYDCHSQPSEFSQLHPEEQMMHDADDIDVRSARPTL